MALVYPVGCVGNVHTSVIEFLLRGGAHGVLIASCPPRDCQGREGTRWLEARIHEGREAELREGLRTQATANTTANLLMACVEGRIGQFVRSEFKRLPSADWDDQWQLLRATVFR